MHSLPPIAVFNAFGPAGSPFVVASASGSRFQYAAGALNPALDQFLTIWQADTNGASARGTRCGLTVCAALHAGDGISDSVYAQLVSSTTGALIGSRIYVTNGLPASSVYAAPSVAYHPTSQNYFSAFRSAACVHC